MPGWRRRALRPLAGLGGAAPYWTDYEYGKGGNRTKEIRHEAAGDTVRSYEYGNEDGSQPHTLRTVEQTGPDGTSRDEFSYDAAGDMTSRNVGGSPQQLEWDAAGRTSKVTRHDGRESEYLYDVDGYEGAGTGVHTPVKQPTNGRALDVNTRTCNALLRSLHCLGERGFALLTGRWRSLRHLCTRPKSNVAVTGAWPDQRWSYDRARSSPPRCRGARRGAESGESRQMSPELIHSIE